MLTFQELGLDDALLRAIAKEGFVEPMPVQEQVIPIMLNEGCDLVALAQTGTGKTAAFGIPVLQSIDPQETRVQTVILSPTRELCLQIHSDLTALGRFLKHLRMVAVYGGASIEKQIRELNRNPQIVVATPGRLLDMIRRGEVDLSQVHNLVLDEADEMLNMGFADELNAILAETPETKRVALFSATMPKEVGRIAQQYMKDPMEITIGTRNAMADQLTHQVYLARPGDRYAVVKRIVDFNPDLYAILFCRTRQETKDMAEQLWQDGYSCDALHGDLSQGQRETVMNRFRSRQFRLLVATDVAARGIDISDLSHVIHLNLPQDESAYTHRSGRTGRAGKSGVSVLVASPADRFRLQRLEKQLGVRFEFLPVPSGQEVCQRKVVTQIDRLIKVSEEAKQDLLEPYMDLIAERLAGVSPEALMKRWLTLELGEQLTRYRSAPDLNLAHKQGAAPERKREKFRKESAQSVEFSKLMISLGKRDQVTPLKIMGWVAEATAKRDIEIGRIEIFKSFTLFEVDQQFEQRVLKGFNAMNRGVKGLKVTKVDRPPKEAQKGRKRAQMTA